MYNIGYFKAFLCGVLIILIVFSIIGFIYWGIRLQIECYSSDKIVDMPGYCVLVL